MQLPCLCTFPSALKAHHADTAHWSGMTHLQAVLGFPFSGFWQLYDLETAYLQDTNQTGSVFRGYDAFLAARSNFTK